MRMEFRFPGCEFGQDTGFLVTVGAGIPTFVRFQSLDACSGEHCERPQGAPMVHAPKSYPSDIPASIPM